MCANSGQRESKLNGNLCVMNVLFTCSINKCRRKRKPLNHYAGICDEIVLSDCTERAVSTLPENNKPLFSLLKYLEDDVKGLQCLCFLEISSIGDDHIQDSGYFIR